MVTDCDAYLPPCDVVTTYFMKDLIMGRRKCKLQTKEVSDLLSLTILVVKNSSLKRIHVPHYENLKRKDIWNEVIAPRQDLHVYFPVLKEMIKLPREWLMNVMMTLCP